LFGAVPQIFERWNLVFVVGQLGFPLREHDPTAGDDARKQNTPFPHERPP
jgi:hypothetical protein